MSKVTHDLASTNLPELISSLFSLICFKQDSFEFYSWKIDIVETLQLFSLLLESFQYADLFLSLALRFLLFAWGLSWIFQEFAQPPQRSLVGYSPQGHKKSDTTEWLHFHNKYIFTFSSTVSPSPSSPIIPKRQTRLFLSSYGLITFWLHIEKGSTMSCKA